MTDVCSLGTSVALTAKMRYSRMPATRALAMLPALGSVLGLCAREKPAPPCVRSRGRVALWRLSSTFGTARHSHSASAA
eukprot:15472588-Alexandrium_andersonii.AAC.1